MQSTQCHVLLDKYKLWNTLYVRTSFLFSGLSTYRSGKTLWDWERDKKGSNGRLNLEKISFSNRYTTVDLLEVHLQLLPACHHICSSLLLTKVIFLQKTLVSFSFFFLYPDLLFVEITGKSENKLPLHQECSLLWFRHSPTSAAMVAFNKAGPWGLTSFPQLLSCHWSFDK